MDTLPHTHPIPLRRAAQSWSLLIIVVLALAVSACSKPLEKAEEIRPVRVVKLLSSTVDVNVEFAGEVRARVESRLAFRVG